MAVDTELVVEDNGRGGAARERGGEKEMCLVVVGERVLLRREVGRRRGRASARGFIGPTAVRIDRQNDERREDAEIPNERLHRHQSPAREEGVSTFGQTYHSLRPVAVPEA